MGKNHILFYASFVSLINKNKLIKSNQNLSQNISNEKNIIKFFGKSKKFIRFCDIHFINKQRSNIQMIIYNQNDNLWDD